MIIKLMTWFIKLWNRFNESRLFKTSTIYVLNWINNLISWQYIMIKLIIKKFLITWKNQSTIESLSSIVKLSMT